MFSFSAFLAMSHKIQFSKYVYEALLLIRCPQHWLLTATPTPLATMMQLTLDMRKTHSASSHMVRCSPGLSELDAGVILLTSASQYHLFTSTCVQSPSYGRRPLFSIHSPCEVICNLQFASLLSSTSLKNRLGEVKWMKPSQEQN